MKFLILGGNLTNLGAQSMVFTVINELKPHFKESTFFLMSTEESLQKNHEKYNFQIKPWRFRTLLIACMHRLTGMEFFLSEEQKNFVRFLSDVDFIIDVSGFALSSQFKIYRSFKYILNITLAKQFGIPIYLLSQSFGPFKYIFPLNFIIKYLLRGILSYPRKIFAREEQSFNNISQFTKKNLFLHRDIVLTRVNMLEKDVIGIKDSVKQLEFSSSNGVAVIPNKMANTNKNNLVNIYCSAISSLPLSTKVYLIVHSKDDLEICKTIKEKFINQRTIRIIDHDLNSLEITNIFKNFDFVIASRYHSIIHGYEVGVPAVIIGWAEKYHELANLFEQEEFIFDTREKINLDDLSIAINKMLNEGPKISKNIALLKKKITSGSYIFEEIIKDMTNEK